jgi:calcium binding protein 39
MSFLFGRRPRTNTVDLPKQAKEQISKLDGPAGAAKVGALLAPKGKRDVF